jgi:hypothetical protein
MSLRACKVEKLVDLGLAYMKPCLYWALARHCSANTRNSHSAVE